MATPNCQGQLKLFDERVLVKSYTIKHCYNKHAYNSLPLVAWWFSFQHRKKYKIFVLILRIQFKTKWKWMSLVLPTPVLCKWILLYYSFLSIVDMVNCTNFCTSWQGTSNSFICCTFNWYLCWQILYDFNLNELFHKDVWLSNDLWQTKLMSRTENKVSINIISGFPRSSHVLLCNSHESTKRFII